MFLFTIDECPGVGPEVLSNQLLKGQVHNQTITDILKNVNSWEQSIVSFSGDLAFQVS